MYSVFFSFGLKLVYNGYDILCKRLIRGIVMRFYIADKWLEIIVLLLLVVLMGFMKKRSVFGCRMSIFLAGALVMTSFFCFVSSMFFGGPGKIILNLVSLCLSAYILKLNLNRFRRYRIVMDDVRELLDMYFLVYVELSMEGGFDLKPLENVIRDNHIMEINKIMVERTLIQNESETEMFDFLMHLYDMDMREWFRKCIDDITVWHGKGSVPIVDTHYYSLKRKIEFLDSMESR